MRHLIPLNLRIIAACLVFFSGCENPFSSKDKDQFKIIYEDENSLHKVSLDGNDYQKIHDLDGTPFQISWSPDAQKILIDVYSTQYAILNPDGSDYKVLDHKYAFPAVWLDNETIIFSKSDSVFSLNVETEHLKVITEGIRPSLSPDRTKIAYIKNEHELYISNSDGTHPQKIIDSLYMGSSVAWSPDKKQIAFIRDRSLWKVSLENKEEVKLSPENYWVLGNSSWSPDGTMILGILRKENAIDLPFIIDQKGDSFTLLSEDVKAPQWLPKKNSNTIVYTSATEKRIMKMKANGTGAESIVSIESGGFYLCALSPKRLH